MGRDKQVEKLLKQLSPDQQAFAKAVSHDRIELGHLRRAYAQTQKEYKELWNLLIVMLITVPDRKLTIHKSQFLKFQDSYRILRYWDEKKENLTFELKTITDELGPSGEGKGAKETPEVDG